MLRRSRTTSYPTWPLLPTLAFLALIFFLPVCQLLWLTFIDEAGNFDFVGIRNLWSTPLYARVLLITFQVSAWTTLVSILAAYPVAYLVATTERTTSSLLLILILVPFWTSFLVRGFAWIILLGQHGAINSLLMALDIIDAPAKLIYTFSAVIVSMVHSMMPMAILTMVAVMRTINPILPRAAETLGARGSESFWRIYFPLSLPGVAAAGLLVLVTALGFFIMPALLGSARETMITQLLIAAVQTLLNWQLAGALSLALLLATGVVFFVYDRLLGLSTLSGELSRKPSTRQHGSRLHNAGTLILAAAGRFFSLGPELMERLVGIPRSNRGAAISRLALWTGSVAVIAFLILPSLIVVPVALNSGEFLEFPPRGLSLRWFEAYLASDTWLSATYRSFLVATTTGILSTILGAAAAFVLVFANVVGRSTILFLLLLPMIVPRMIFAVGLFKLYSVFGLVGSLFGIALGHTAIALPYVVVTMLALFKTYDVRLDYAAWTLGANRLQSLGRVMLPQLYDGLIAGFLFAFVTSFDDLTVSLFISGGLTSTLPRQMWSAIFLEVSPILAAVSTVVLMLVTSLVVIGELLRRRTVRQ